MPTPRFIFPLIALALLLPACGTLNRRSQRAAVAIRDNVSPFQKWGTRTFTRPQLQWTYDRTCYFTQSAPDDQHQPFVAALTELLQQYPSVDLFLLAHSNHYHQWVAEIDPQLRTHLRLVYNTGCYDAAQADIWLRLGAAAYVAHPDNSDSPVCYVFFLSKWLWGFDARAATDAANYNARCAFGFAVFCHIGGVDAHSADRSRANLFGNPQLTIDQRIAPTTLPSIPPRTGIPR